MEGIHLHYCHHYHPLTYEEAGPTEARHRREDKQPPGHQCSSSSSSDTIPPGPSLLLWENLNPFLRHSWELQDSQKGRCTNQSAHLPGFFFFSIISRGIKKKNFQKACLFSWPLLGGPVLLEPRQLLVRVYYEGRPKSHLWLIL